MNYVKQFDILGVDSRQTSCIELKGAPNAATEGAVGVLGMDITSPTRDVYKCVGVNGGVYTWMPISEMPEVKDGENGLSLLSAVESRSGLSIVTFPFYQLNLPDGYTVKVGDLILDPDGYIYQVTLVEKESCTAKYIGSQVLTKLALGEMNPTCLVTGSYVGTAGQVTLMFDIIPKIIFFTDGTFVARVTNNKNSITFTGHNNLSEIYYYSALCVTSPAIQKVETLSVKVWDMDSDGTVTENYDSFVVEKGTTWAEFLPRYNAVNGRGNTTQGFWYGVGATTGRVIWRCESFETGTTLKLDYLLDKDGNYVLGSDIIEDTDYYCKYDPNMSFSAIN